MSRYRSLASWSSALTIGAEGLGLDYRAGQIGTVSPTARQCFDVSVFPSRQVEDMTPSGVCKGGAGSPAPLTIAEKINYDLILKQTDFFSCRACRNRYRYHIFSVRSNFYCLLLLLVFQRHAKCNITHMHLKEKRDKARGLKTYRYVSEKNKHKT